MIETCYLLSATYYDIIEKHKPMSQLLSLVKLENIHYHN